MSNSNHEHRISGVASYTRRNESHCREIESVVRMASPYVLGTTVPIGSGWGSREARFPHRKIKLQDARTFIQL